MACSLELLDHNDLWLLQKDKNRVGELAHAHIICNIHTRYSLITARNVNEEANSLIKKKNYMG